MNWDAMGAIAELAGAMGVIASLLYLATQIRVQNRESRLEASRNPNASFNDFLSDMANNAELSSIYLRGLKDLSSLDEVEYMQWWETRKHWFSSDYAAFIETHRTDRA